MNNGASPTSDGKEDVITVEPWRYWGTGTPTSTYVPTARYVSPVETQVVRVEVRSTSYLSLAFSFAAFLLALFAVLRP